MADRAAEKPRFGEPCNGCGFCCAAEPCKLAREYAGAGDVGPCPAMEFEDSKFRCGLVAHPHRFLGGPAFADAITGALFADALGIGQGCDSDDPDAFLKREAA